MTEANPQELLWAVPSAVGNWWWVVCGVLAITAAILCFLYLIMNERFSAVIFSRVLMTGGYIAIGMTPLNSGWLPWGVLLLSAGGAYTYFLLATNWCMRHDKWSIIRGWMNRLWSPNAQPTDAAHRSRGVLR